MQLQKNVSDVLLHSHFVVNNDAKVTNSARRHYALNIWAF